MGAWTMGTVVGMESSWSLHMFFMICACICHLHSTVSPQVPGIVYSCISMSYTNLDTQ